MSRKRIFSLTWCVSLLIAFGCTDTNIEGTSNTSTGFTISKTTSAYTTVNTGACFATAGKNGTNFTVTVEYQGSELITGIKLAYKFSTGSTGNVTLSPNSDYVDTHSGTPGTFRSASGSSNVKINSCVVFGTSTSITYDYTITTNSLKNYTTSIIINKPVGAN